ncbi:protein of unknown function [Streptomyces sp. KY75]|nr:protein of unknown function [Streptomyces sp. KY75]CAD5993924.1 protein of unknown function [Streptomyces sp. KY70]
MCQLLIGQGALSAVLDCFSL